MSKYDFVYKKGPSINFLSAFTKYASENNYNLTESINRFFGLLSGIRSSASSLYPGNDELLNTNRLNIIQYLQHIKLISYYFFFGNKMNEQVNLSFKFQNIFREKEQSSYNLDLEYYICLYNLGVTYALQGKNSFDKMDLNTISDDELKTMRKNFSMAAFAFDKIKEEIFSKVETPEIPDDLNSNYLLYLKTLSQIYAQKIAIIFAGKLGSKPDLITKLSCGVKKLYQDLINYSRKDPLCRYLSSKDNYSLSYQLKYNEYLFVNKKIEELKDTYSKCGKGYSDIIALLEYCIQILNEVKQAAYNLGDTQKVSEMETLIKATQLEYNERFDMNKKLFHEPVKPANLDDHEFKIMADPIPIPEIEKELILEDNNLKKNLELIMPTGLRSMIQSFRENVVSYLNDKLSTHYNRDKHTQFFKEANLPERLLPGKEKEESKIVGYNMSEELWNKIKSIKDRNSVFQLNDMMKEIMAKSSQTESELLKAYERLEQDEKEDLYWRQRYPPEKWVMTPSNTFRPNLTQKINYYAQIIKNARPYDAKMQEAILKNTKDYELFFGNREEIESKIPEREKYKNKNITFLTKEQVGIRNQVFDINEKYKELEKVVQAIYEDFQNDFEVHKSFLLIYNHKATERVIFDHYLEKLQPSLDKIIQISQGIQDDVKKVLDKLNSNPNIRTDKVDESKILETNAKNYFNNLEKIINSYEENYRNLTTGKNHYEKLYQQAQPLIANINGMLNKRAEERMYLVNILNGQRQGFNYY